VFAKIMLKVFSIRQYMIPIQIQEKNMKKKNLKKKKTKKLIAATGGG
jgi:hypothetical protein